jgi:PEGA domain
MSQPMGHRRIAAGVLAGILIVGPTSGAWAQQKAGVTPTPAATSSAADIASAKKHYADGEKKLKAQDFEGALVDFKAANDIKSVPQVEQKIAICEDNLGHFPAAVDWYEKFLGHVPDKLAAQAEEIKKRVATLEAMPGKVRIESTPPGAAVTVDGKLQTELTPLDVELPSGTHDIKLTQAGRLPSSKSVDVSFASTQTVTAALDPEPPPPVAVAVAPPAPPPAPAPTPPEPRSLIPAYITGGLAVAAAGVGTIFGILALNDKSSFDKNPTTATADNGDTHSLIADMAFGVAVTFGVTSAVLFLTKDEPTPAAASTAPRNAADARNGGSTKTAKANHVTFTPVPMVGAHLAGAGLVLHF